MIEHDIEDEPGTTGVQCIDDTIEIFERAEEWIDIGVVGNVVAEIEHRRAIHRGQPDRTDAEPGEMIYPRKDAREVTDPIAIRILKGARADLTNRAAFSPLQPRLGLLLF